MNRNEFKKKGENKIYKNNLIFAGLKFPKFDVKYIYIRPGTKTINEGSKKSEGKFVKTNNYYYFVVVVIVVYL